MMPGVVARARAIVSIQIFLARKWTRELDHRLMVCGSVA